MSKTININEDLHKKLKKYKIDLVTLYRTLASFEKNKLVKRVDLHKDAIYYELNLEHHHHIVCVECGKVDDLQAWSSPASSARTVKAKSRPAVTPPPVMMFPSRTTRPSSTMAPKGWSNSRQAQWQAARRPVRNPAAARISDPVQTEVR